MNHCSVALKITGFLQRQQCGYECSICSVKRSAPSAFSFSMICAFALEDVHALEGFNFRGEFTLLIHGRIDIEAVLETGLIVFLAVTGCDVDSTGAHVLRDILREDDNGRPN